jgi:hypothetical protein
MVRGIMRIDFHLAQFLELFVEGQNPVIRPRPRYVTIAIVRETQAGPSLSRKSVHRPEKDVCTRDEVQFHRAAPSEPSRP